MAIKRGLARRTVKAIHLRLLGQRGLLNHIAMLALSNLNSLPCAFNYFVHDRSLLRYVVPLAVSNGFHLTNLSSPARRLHADTGFKPEGSKLSYGAFRARGGDCSCVSKRRPHHGVNCLVLIRAIRVMAFIT